MSTAPTVTRKPRRRVVRAGNRQRHRDEHLRRLAAARTPSGRLGAASDYLRSAIRGAIDPDAANRMVDELVPDLIRRADRLLTTHPRSTNR